MENTKIVTLKKSDIDMMTSPSNSHINKLYTFFIKDQHKNNSCAVMTLISMIEYLRQIEGKDFIQLSDNFVYYNSMKINGDSKKGLKTCSVIRSILQYGACDQRRWSSIYDANIKPTPNIIIESFSNLKDTTVEIIECSIECIRYILGNCKRPISANIKMYNNCLNGNLKNEELENEKENIYNHSVLLVGYDDELKLIYFQNSYGKKWGNNGFGTFTYEYISNINSMYSMDESCIKSLDIKDKNQLIHVIEK